MPLPIKHSGENQSWLGWAFFLGVSWTWCIGMFLPVILVRDYGAWAWLVFAVPNVVGAAAMAWMIDAEKSRLMVSTHRTAITAFSTITVAFQIFFAVWVFTRPPWQAAGHGWYLAGVALIALAATFRKHSQILAAAIFLGSIACAIGMFHHGEARLGGSGVATELSASPSAAVGWLTPLCLFGFLLCPYLDGTFHRARQSLEGTSARLAFGLGFGVVFFSAIALSLLYAGPVHVAMYAVLRDNLILRWVKVYWMLQLGFTIGVHLIGDDAPEKARRSHNGAFIALGGLLLGMIALAVGSGLKLPGEAVYRYFLSFYGLVFPAYVWLCVLPGRGVQLPTRRAVTVFVIAVLIASPMFWLAFIAQQIFWAAPAVALLLASRLLISRSEESGERATSVQFSV